MTCDGDLLSLHPAILGPVFNIGLETLCSIVHTGYDNVFRAEPVIL